MRPAASFLASLREHDTGQRRAEIRLGPDVLGRPYTTYGIRIFMDGDAESIVASAEDRRQRRTEN